VGIQHTKMPETVWVPPQVPSVSMEAGAGGLIWNPLKTIFKITMLVYCP